MNTQILIVDDEEMIRTMQAESLEEQGYVCLTAGGADEALLLAQRHPVDLALIDINMPGRSGVQLLREIKESSPDMAAIMVTAVDDVNTAMECLSLGASDYLLKPFHIERLELSVRNALERRRLLLENRAYQHRLEEKVQTQTAQIRETLTQLREAYDITLTSLARALDTREKEVGFHSERVRRYTLVLAGTLAVPEPQLGEMARGALLHDIGKIGISDSILLKPGRLDEAEWTEMHRHPQLGYDIIADIGFLVDAAQIVLNHHERFAGGGYPRGLKGEEIPLGARIFAVIDTLDAMTSDRPYRMALPYKAVVEEVKRCSGTQFDPKVVDAFPHRFPHKLGRDRRTPPVTVGPVCHLNADAPSNR